jgi:hypothetical protein
MASFNYEIRNGKLITPKRGRSNTSDTISACWSTPEDYDSNDNSNNSSSDDQGSAPSSSVLEERRVTTSPDDTLESYAIHPQRRKMKKQRSRRTAGGALGGCIVGGLVLGPLGSCWRVYHEQDLQKGRTTGATEI